MPVTVLLADDSERVRKVIVSLLQIVPDIRIVAEASSFAQTMELASELHPQVILLDVHMGDEGCITPAQIKSGLMGSCLLAMSIWTDEGTQSSAKALGSEVLLDKCKLGVELIQAIRNCINEQGRDPKSRAASAPK
jgi:DNA-binding NarL/FixJ family response regulator